MPKISIIVPCCNEEESLPLFYREISRVVKEMEPVEFEFLFIDDGSRDHTLPLLREYARADQRVRFLSFSRNFGKEAGMLAGLKEAAGEYAVFMDADLQDPPGLLPELYQAVAAEGYDCAAARRTDRKGEPPIRSLFARLFYKWINLISNADIVDGARDYRLINRRVINAVLSMKEYNRFSKGIFGWVGFQTKWVPYVNAERAAGETKWSFWKLFLYALEGIIAFSTVPLAVSSVLGTILCGGSVFGMIFMIVKDLFLGSSAAVWGIVICVVLLIGGLQLLSIGVLGQYLAKTYMESKRRPVYLVRETEKGLV